MQGLSPKKLKVCMCALMCVCCVCCCVCAVHAHARKLSRKLEPLSQFKATSSREMSVKAQLQESVITHCLGVELHSLVLFLINGFMFAMPGSMARMNPTARLHAFADIRHICKGSVSIDTVYDWNKSST